MRWAISDLIDSREAVYEEPDSDATYLASRSIPTEPETRREPCRPRQGTTARDSQHTVTIWNYLTGGSLSRWFRKKNINGRDGLPVPIWMGTALQHYVSRVNFRAAMGRVRTGSVGGHRSRARAFLSCRYNPPQKLIGHNVILVDPSVIVIIGRDLQRRAANAGRLTSLKQKNFI